jgi:UTP--glucose-1-phosphate uridylyltransferase
MEIRRAVITAAGRNQRTLPLQTLIDCDGVQKAALQILVEEALAAGVHEVGVVVAPNDAAAYRLAAGPHAGRLHFVEQTEPRGFGHAVFQAAPFTAREPFLLLVGDHLYLSGGEGRCAQQLVANARAEACSVSAVQATHESKLPLYGTVGGRLVAGRPGVYEVERVIEKPTPTEAEQKLIVPGLRAGHYLCFFGMHVLTPAVMDLLGEQIARAGDAPESVTLSSALAELAGRERYLANELGGRRYNLGLKYGLLAAQLALALAGSEREEVLAMLVELLASRAE